MARVAILIDGDNVSHNHAARIAALGAAEGRVDVHRAYVNAANGSAWASEPGVHVVHAGSGKNAADLLLSIDAMELALTSWFDTFVLASSDRDFTHLATRLRAHGSAVIGAGVSGASKRLQMNCSRFVELAAPVTDFDRKIRDMVVPNSDGGLGMRITELGARMHQKHKVLIKNHKPGKWRGYLATRPDLYELDKRGKDARVRIRQDGFMG